MKNPWVRLPGDAFYTLRGTMSDPDKRRIMVRIGNEKAPYMFQNYWDAYDFVAEHLDRPLLDWAEA